MSKKAMIQAALLSVVSIAATTIPVSSHADSLGKCFGIAKAGQNGCAGLTGNHTCKGTSSENYNPGDFKVVSQDECKKMGGLSKDEAMDIVHDTAKVKAFEEMMIKRNS
ncbi:DUF2282 domain-containing protein [Ferrovum sp. PN-J185]|uniref:BufA1 family periplasmic bufferin-type metallophore n=1 Tax=Ferrovum sp. PN-J185 TaxID=1356306 RepID=UPI000791E623|nr:DUF2282 domain-containing protein [Ferrovum sp. PN-J185]KXW56736.1 hypothetical protein FV185_06950 [Ferrovum sp. PN-J185]MCC6067579.1 DUF2282 domain-containing protein [Ferrovum sp. PN-J185]MDE1892061.1 DUF2282 domain-containing protein [Betaproteobacteria bacterium]MDE2056490.1 DUF2282 domain-containing protein [Betaproteobacteria bacterium]